MEKEGTGEKGNKSDRTNRTDAGEGLEARNGVEAVMRFEDAAGMGFIPAHGGYEELASYQMALIVFQGTVRFCERFLKRGDRTIDQMVQAARSGKQNIVEGCQVSGTSKEAELKLINVARASLEELLEDYRDFLRVKKMAIWEKDSKEALFVRALGKKPNKSYKAYETYIETRPAEVVANLMVCVINQTNFLLDRQLRALEEAFLREGGLRERMTRARLEERERQKSLTNNRR